MTRDDDVFEGDEDFQLDLEVDMATMDAGILVGSPDVAVVTIFDNENLTVFFQPSAYNVSEGEVALLTVVADRKFERSFNVTVTTVVGSAVMGEDYIHFSGVVRMDADTQIGVAMVTTLPDEVYECTENFTGDLSLSDTTPTGVFIGEPSMATVDIQDATDLCVTLNSSSYEVEEGESAVVKVTLDKQITCPVSVMVMLVDGTAVAPEDYNNSTTTVTFSPGSQMMEVRIGTRPDNIAEGDETFMVMLALEETSDRVSLCEPNKATVTIVDQTICVVIFNPDEYGVTEGTVATLMLELSAEVAPGVDVEVTVVTVNNTAHSPLDFAGGIYTAVFSGTNKASLDIQTYNDTVTEGPESFFANILIPLSSALKLRAGDPDQATVDINDASMLEVFFSQSVYCVNESDPVAVITVVASGVHQMSYNISVSILQGTAKVFEDYESLSVELTFEPGETMKTFEIPIINDLIVEDMENAFMEIFISKSALRVGVINGSPRRAMLKIVDDDCVTVNFDPSSYSVVEGGTETVTLVSSASGEVNAPFNVTVLLRDGSAVAPGDYSRDSSPYTVVFNPGESTASFTVDTVGDDVLECSEDFEAVLMERMRGNGVCVVIGEPDTARIEIQDDEDPLEVMFEPILYSVEEGGKVNITMVTSTSAYSFPFSVSLMFMDMTASGGSDYVPQPVTVAFSPGQEEVSFEVMTVEDNIAEISESFKIIITEVTSSCDSSVVVVGGNNQSTVQIVDNDWI
jgi:hypothetical protein